MSNDLLNKLMNLSSTDDKSVKLLRAPFGYPGSKAKSAHIIIEHLPYRNTYVEPFGGSAAVLLARRPCKLEVYNDRHSGVTLFYRCLRSKDKMEQLINRLKLTINSKEEFYYAKEYIEQTTDEVEIAALWYYINQYSVSTLGRNWGRALKGNGFVDKIIGHLPLFQRIHERFRNVQVDNQDYIECILDYDSIDTVFYLDPPYLNSALGAYKHDLTKDDHKELLNLIFGIKGFVAVSGFANPLYDSYDWDERFSWKVRSTLKVIVNKETNNRDSLSGLNEEKDEQEEVLWIKR